MLRPNKALGRDWAKPLAVALRIEETQTMSDVLVRIKRAVLAGRYVFSEKARLEMEADGLAELDVAESILNAVAIFKRVRSRSPLRKQAREYIFTSFRARTWMVWLSIPKVSSCMRLGQRLTISSFLQKRQSNGR